MSQPVQLQNGIQHTNDERVALSTTGSFDGSKTSWILDAIFKVFRFFKSPSPGYGNAAIVGEAQTDFNGQGGLVVGVYGVADGYGKTNPNGVNDIVGVHGTAHKRTDGWSAGLHGDVYDYTPGGIGIGANIEFPKTIKGNRYIGVNIQPNPDGTYEGLNLQGHISTIINTTGGSADTLLELQSGSKMWAGSGDIGGGLGQHVGKIKIKIDNQFYFIPIYK